MKIEGKGNGNILPSQKVEFTVDGKPILLSEASIQFELGGLVEMVARIYVEEINLAGIGCTYHATNPDTGNYQQLQSMEFADGSEWVDPAATHEGMTYAERLDKIEEMADAGIQNFADKDFVEFCAIIHKLVKGEKPLD